MAPRRCCTAVIGCALLCFPAAMAAQDDLEPAPVRWRTTLGYGFANNGAYRSGESGPYEVTAPSVQYMGGLPFLEARGFEHAFTVGYVFSEQHFTGEEGNYEYHMAYGLIEVGRGWRAGPLGAGLHGGAGAGLSYRRVARVPEPEPRVRPALIGTGGLRVEAWRLDLDLALRVQTIQPLFTPIFSAGYRSTGIVTAVVAPALVVGTGALILYLVFRATEPHISIPVS